MTAPILSSSMEKRLWSNRCCQDFGLYLNPRIDGEDYGGRTDTGACRFNAEACFVFRVYGEKKEQTRLTSSGDSSTYLE